MAAVQPVTDPVEEVRVVEGFLSQGLSLWDPACQRVQVDVLKATTGGLSNTSCGSRSWQGSLMRCCDMNTPIPVDCDVNSAAIAKLRTVAASNDRDHPFVARSRHIYMGVVLRAHLVCGESRIQRHHARRSFSEK